MGPHAWRFLRFFTAFDERLALFLPSPGHQLSSFDAERGRETGRGGGGVGGRGGGVDGYKGGGGRGLGSWGKLWSGQ